jgi:hypothetical protein
VTKRGISKETVGFGTFGKLWEANYHGKFGSLGLLESFGKLWND